MNPVATFAERLEELKSIRGIKNSDIARLCDIDKANITRYCKGEYKAKQDVIYKMSQRLGINEAWLLGYDVPMEKIIATDNSDEEVDPIILDLITKLEDAPLPVRNAAIAAALAVLKSDLSKE